MPWPRFKLLEAQIVFRAAFNACAGDGLTVDEMTSRDAPASSEVGFLVEEVFGR